MTQSKLADKLNVIDRAVSKWESGKVCSDISLLEPLSNILNISVIEILNGEEMESQTNNKEILNTVNITKNIIKNKYKAYTNIHTIFIISLLSFIVIHNNISKIIIDNRTIKSNVIYKNNDDDLFENFKNKIKVILNKKGNYSEDEYKNITTYISL